MLTKQMLFCTLVRSLCDKTWTKVKLGGKSLFNFIAYSASSKDVSAETQDRNLQAGAGSQGHRGVLRAGLLPLGLVLSARRPPTQGWYHLEWAGPSHINHQSKKKTATDMPTGLQANLMEPCSLEAPSSQVSRACVKLI